MNITDIFNKLVLFAGPCVIESDTLTSEIATELKNIVAKMQITLVFKASFDKANRTSLSSFRGPGISEGLRVLERIKTQLDIPIITDIHLPQQADIVAEIVDFLQIPAFLCRQTDLITAAARTGKPVMVKKGQFLAPWDMKNIVDKIEENDNRNILLCERGTCFGYNTLVVDMTSIPEMKKLGYPVVFDATHSVQKPSGKGDISGGNREHVEPLALAAIAAGADAIFLETHPNPNEALSDSSSMIALTQLESLLMKVKHIYDTIHSTDKDAKYS